MMQGVVIASSIDAEGKAMMDLRPGDFNDPLLQPAPAPLVETRSGPRVRRRV
jgi:hypothetical protein